MGIDVSRLKAMAPKPTRSNVTDNVITKEDATMAQNNTTATVNANSKEDNTMNISTGKKTAGQFTIEYQQNGYGVETPVVDGEPKPMLTFGYVSEADRQRCRDLIREAYIATNGNDYAVMGYIRQAIKAVLVTKAKAAYDEAEANRRIAEANRNLTDEDLYGFEF